MLRRASRSWLLRKLALLLLRHGFAEEDVVALAGSFGHVDGGVGLLHQDQVILVIVAEQADPHGGTAVQFVIADVEGEPEDPHQLPGKMLRQDLGGDVALAQRREQQGEFVSRGAGQHQVLLGQGLEPNHHGLQQRITAGMAEESLIDLKLSRSSSSNAPTVRSGAQGCAA